IIERPNTVPSLDAGGGITGRVPPPHALLVCPMMNALYLAQLQAVNHQAHIAVLREPRAVMLVRHLVPITDTVLDNRSVAAEVKNRRRRIAQIPGQVKIRCDIEPGPRLEAEVLDDERSAVNLPGHRRLQVRLFRQGPQAEHVEQLLSVLLTA